MYVLCMYVCMNVCMLVYMYVCTVYMVCMYVGMPGVSRRGSFLSSKYLRMAMFNTAARISLTVTWSWNLLLISFTCLAGYVYNAYKTDIDLFSRNAVKFTHICSLLHMYICIG
jgi:hypothetical protein